MRRTAHLELHICAALGVDRARPSEAKLRIVEWPYTLKAIEVVDVREHPCQAEAPAVTARPHPLSRAPDDRACKVVVTRKDGATGPCGRWVLGAGTSRPESRCVAHSQSRRAQEARSRRAVNASASRRSESGRRVDLHGLLGGYTPPRTIDDVRCARRTLMSEIVLGGSITPAEARELRAILSDEERSIRDEERRRR